MCKKSRACARKPGGVRESRECVTFTRNLYKSVPGVTIPARVRELEYNIYMYIYHHLSLHLLSLSRLPSLERLTGLVAHRDAAHSGMAPVATRDEP